PIFWLRLKLPRSQFWNFRAIFGISAERLDGMEHAIFAMVTPQPQLVIGPSYSVPRSAANGRPCSCSRARPSPSGRCCLGGFSMRKSTLGVLLSLLLVAWPAFAQEQRGSIQGVIKDATGAVLPGATVEAKSNTGAAASTTSDANGEYRFPSLAPGVYELTDTLRGFAPTKLGHVEVLLASIKTVDFALKTGGSAEAVQVSAEPPLIDVKQSGRSTSIRGEQIELVPHDRNF